MHIIHANVIYQTEQFDDSKSGSAGVKLLIVANGVTTCVARITFWDAAGQFFMEMTGAEVPLSVMESLIAEAKKSIPLS